MAKDLTRFAPTIVVFDAAAFSTLWFYGKEDDERMSDEPLGPSDSTDADSRERPE